MNSKAMGCRELIQDDLICVLDNDSQWGIHAENIENLRTILCQIVVDRFEEFFGETNAYNL